MECVFCQIVAGRIPAQRVWENEKYTAFLDVYPHKAGQTLVVTKEHRPGYVFQLKNEELAGLVLAAREVGKRLDKALGAVRTCLVFEGLGVDHAHAKLYPIMPGEDVEGLVPLGPIADDGLLSDMALKIRKGGNDG